jgi:hypothetical protein
MATLGSVPGGKLSSQPAPGGKLTECTYQRGATTLKISVGPAIIANGGRGGPATVSKPDPAFGSKGYLAYGTTAPFIYATVSFVKGSYFASVWSNTVSADRVITVATTLYKKL